MPVIEARPLLRQETACAVCARSEYDVVARTDRNGRPLRTVMCRACGLVWTNPRPSAAEVDRYYATTYRLDYARQRTPSRRKILRGLLGAEERRRALAPLMPPGARVLDVGCGAGEFVYLLRRRGVDASGVEPGEAFADFSRRVLQVPVETATVETATVGDGSCRLVTMFHMLEHVADPRRTLATIARWLEPSGGRLVVEVPDIASTVQAPRNRFHYAHLHSFTGDTLAALGSVAGLRPIRVEQSPDGGVVTVLFSRLEGEPVAPAPLPETVARLQRVFREHTAVRHFLGATPYRRAAGRLARRWREDRLLRQMPTIEAVLAWADDLGGRAL
jgi:SAM-dependent methyltransferase